ncbi:hypothetical protein [Staphylococcus xylosus]|uniref:hypothetical protein n=1 Tax=Staphylococcus xylosus TaxID=1288 RepID=UPI003F557061
MNDIYKAILTLGAIIAGIYKVSKWLKESKENNSDNAINIWIESLKISIPIAGCVLPFILLVYFININGGIIYDILSILYIIVIFIVIIRGVFVFFIKRGYKDKYGDIIHTDCIRYRKESDNAYSTINAIQLEIAGEVLDHNFNYKEDLEQAKKIYQSKPELHSITKRYNKLCRQSWLSVVAVNGFLILSIFESSDGNVLGYVGSSIIVTIFICLVNTLNIYSDLRIEHGKLNSTITKIEKHEKVYDKFLEENEKSKGNYIEIGYEK